MSTLTARKAELTSAMATGGVAITSPGRVAPPCGLVYGNGIPDMEGVGRGQVVGQFRVTLLAGKADAGASAAALDALLHAALAVARGMAGWGVVEVRPDTLRSIAGSDLLSADLILSAMVDV